MTNYYTNKPTTAKEFFNTVCTNHIKHAIKTNERIIHVLVRNLTIDMLEILNVAKENGYNARLYKSRTLVINL